MRPGMRHPPPGPPIRPPQRLMPAPMDGGVFFGGRDFNRRQVAPPPPPPPQQQPQQQQPSLQIYQQQKPLLPPTTPQQQWQNNNNHRAGPMPLLRQPGPWYSHGGNFPHPAQQPPPLLHPHFKQNSQVSVNYGSSHHAAYDASRLTNSDQIPFLEPNEDDDNIHRSHGATNNSNPEEYLLNLSPTKSNKHRRSKPQPQQQPQQQAETNRYVISYQDLDRPEEPRDAPFDNRLVPKSGKTNSLPSDKTNNAYSMKSSNDNDQALKLELDRIKKADAQEREKLKAQRQAAAEKDARLRKNSVQTGEKEKREDGELGDSSDDENTKSTLLLESQRPKKTLEEVASQAIRSSGTLRPKTPPNDNTAESNIMELTRPFKLFHLDDDKNSAYREYLTTNFGRVRVYCYKPQPNFFSNVACIEETKRRLRSTVNATSTIIFRHLVDENDHDVLVLRPTNTEPEDGEIESDDENTPMEVNRKSSKHKSSHHLSDDDNEKNRRKRSRMNDDGAIESLKSSLNEKPWMTNELRQLIKQRNRLQAQILNGQKTAEVEKKFKKIRNKITKLAKTLKAKYENTVSGSSELSLAPPSSTQQKSSSAMMAANHPLSSILDPNLVMAMLVNPSLYSQVQQQVLSNPTFMQAYQHMFVDGSSSGVGSTKSVSSQPLKVASETQVVPSTNPSSTTVLDELKKQVLAQKPGTEQQTQISPTTRSRTVLTQATKPIQLSSLETDTDTEQRIRTHNNTKSDSKGTENSSADNQTNETALTQELIRRQIMLAQQRNQRNPQSTGPIPLSSVVNRHMPFTSEQMQEVLTRAKNYVTRQQTDELGDSNSSQPRISYNTRRLQAALAASASSATPPTAHAIGQAAAAAIAAVTSRPTAASSSLTITTATATPVVAPVTITSSTNSLTTMTTATIVPTTAPGTAMSPNAQISAKTAHTPLNRTPSIPSLIGSAPNSSIPSTPQQQSARIQSDQKPKPLLSISSNQSLPIPTIGQQKIMPLIDTNPSQPPHIYSNAPNWQRHPPPHIPGQHYPMQSPQQQQQQQQPQHYPPYETSHPPPYYAQRMNYTPDMRPMLPYGPLPPRNMPQPTRFNGPIPHQGPYGYGHPPPPPQNYGPTGPPPRPHYGHSYPQP